MMGTTGIFLFVVVQRASVPWLLQWAKVDGAYPFSSNSVVVSVTFFEILLGVSIACSSRGLFRGVAETLNPWELKKWFCLGLSQAVSDMLELYANKYLDASTYQVMLQSKLLVTALLIATVTNRGATQSSLEWLLLVALSLGLTTYSILSNGSGTFSGLGSALAIFKVILSCTNAVFTERILKQSEGTPLVHQIVHMKVFWCLWSVVCMAVLEGPSVYAPTNFFRGWGISVILVMFTYVVKNWSGSFLLKTLDSLLKNIAEAFAMLVLYLVEISPFFGKKKAAELPTFCVTVMVMLLVCAYLESKKRAQERSTGVHMSFQQLLGRPIGCQESGPGKSPVERGSRRLGKKYGLLPSHSLKRLPSSCRFVANSNASQSDVQAAHLKSSSSLLTVPMPWARDVENPKEPETEEAGKECFGVLDTVQALLQHALDSNGEKWQRSVTEALEICKGLKPYLEAASSKVSPDCQAIADATHTMDWPELHRSGQTRELYHSGMMTSAVQSQMLGFFCSMLSAKRILEVGSFTGFTTLCMAEATHGRVMAVEYDPYLVGFAKKMFGQSVHGHKIDLVCGDALDVINGMGVAKDDTDRFDLIFIDGDKTQYVKYFQLINDKDLLAPGGLICIDETLWKGCVYNAVDTSSEALPRSSDSCVAKAMRELNAAIAADLRLVSILLPIRNGLTLVRRLDDHIGSERDHFGQPIPLQPMRPRQRRGVSQEGLALQSQVPCGGRRRTSREKPEIPSPVADEPEARETPEIPSPIADEPEAQLERQSTVGSVGSDFLPCIDSVAVRLQTC